MRCVLTKENYRLCIINLPQMDKSDNFTLGLVTYFVV